MDTDHDVRTPFFKLPTHIADAPLVKKLPRLGTDLVDDPVEVFHPVLLVLQYPVVPLHHFLGDVMGIFDSLYRADGDRFAVPKTLDPIRYCLRRRAMPATGVGGNDEDFWSGLGHLTGGI